MASKATHTVHSHSKILILSVLLCTVAVIAYAFPDSTMEQQEDSSLLAPSGMTNSSGFDEGPGGDGGRLCDGTACSLPHCCGGVCCHFPCCRGECCRYCCKGECSKHSCSDSFQ